MKYFLLGTGYDGQERKALLKLLDVESGKVVVQLDDTGHKPYCLSDLAADVLAKDPQLREAGAVEFIEVEKYDSVNDRKKVMTMIKATDPLAVGGSKKSIRERIKCWEADIPYHLNYVYDMRLIPSLVYRLDGGKLFPVLGDDERINQIMERFFHDTAGAEAEETRKWLKILESEHPHIDFVAVDIEILGESPTRVPSPSNPEDRVVAVSLSGTKNMGRVLVLKRDDVDMKFDGGEYALEVFDDESMLLLRCFEIMEDYPVVVSFNGDDFDLPYLRNRAEKLGIPQQRRDTHQPRKRARPPKSHPPRPL
ncbi:MAG: 3'-5' exonuclease [Candidatus Caldarchaeum sp.]|nr:3'-5' exonuclease [Candidatus Caldarchaeum sp.]